MVTGINFRLIIFFLIFFKLQGALNSQDTMKDINISIKPALESYKSKKLKIVDIRTYKEWKMTGIIPDSFLINMHEEDFSENINFINETERTKKAVMHYKLIKELDRYFVLEIKIETGRHHQIRCQLKAIGCPIKGDLKYGYERSNSDGGIDLHAKKIIFEHPVTKKLTRIEAPLRNTKIWSAIK